MYVNTDTLDRITRRQIRQAHPEVSLPRQPSDAQLAPLGYAVLHETERPAGDVITEGTPEQRDDGTWHQAWKVRDYTEDERAEALERARQRKRREINAERDRRLYPGRLATDIAPVDLRDERDERNLGHLRATAQERHAADDDTPLPFRDADNVTHSLSPADTLALTDAALGHGQQVYATSWALKDQLAAADTLADIDAVAWPQDDTP